MAIKTPVRLRAWHTADIEDADGRIVANTSGPAEAEEIIALLNGKAAALDATIALIDAAVAVYDECDAANETRSPCGTEFRCMTELRRSVIDAQSELRAVHGDREEFVDCLSSYGPLAPREAVAAAEGQS